MDLAAAPRTGEGPVVGLGFSEAQPCVGIADLVAGDELAARKHVFREPAVRACEWLAVIREEAEGARLILECLELMREREDSLGEPVDAGVEVIVGLERRAWGTPSRFVLRGLRCLPAGGTRRRPLPEDPPVPVGAAHLEREQAAWVRGLVDPTTWDASDHGFETGVMVTEETDPRLRPGQEFVEPGCLADVARAAAVSLEGDSGWRVVGQHDVEAATGCERVDLVARVVPLRVPLEGRRRTLEVRGAEAPIDAADAEDVITGAQLPTSPFRR
ncbi:MAG: hypothetical protein R3B13_27420 [Polyangiaceae bacterium]